MDAISGPLRSSQSLPSSSSSILAQLFDVFFFLSRLFASSAITTTTQPTRGLRKLEPKSTNSIRTVIERESISIFFNSKKEAKTKILMDN